MKIIESNKHKYAKEILAEWLGSESTTKTEVPFYIDGVISFVPDVVCYSKGVPFAFWEVVHKHGMTGQKLGRIQSWSYRNNNQVGVYEIDAEWIMTRVEKPDQLKYLEYSILI